MTEGLQRALSAAGLRPDSAVWVGDPAVDVSAPPEGVWAVASYGSQYVVGAMGRGKFAAYEALWTAEDAVNLVVRLIQEPLMVRTTPLSPDEKRAGDVAARGILTRTQARGGSAGPAAIAPGEQVDLIGPETSHHLFALGTSVPRRSIPPSDVGAAYFTFEVVTTFPLGVLEGRAAPWFGQPGGGAMLVLDRPVRWYVDHDYLKQLPGGSQRPD